MTKKVTLAYTKLTFNQAKEQGDIARMNDMFKRLLTMLSYKNLKITLLKKQIKQLKAEQKTEVSQ